MSPKIATKIEAAAAYMDGLRRRAAALGAVLGLLGAPGAAVVGASGVVLEAAGPLAPAPGADVRRFDGAWCLGFARAVSGQTGEALINGVRVVYRPVTDAETGETLAVLAVYERQ